MDYKYSKFPLTGTEVQTLTAMYEYSLFTKANSQVKEWINYKCSLFKRFFSRNFHCDE